MTCNFCPRACEILSLQTSKRPDFSRLAFVIRKKIFVLFVFFLQTANRFQSAVTLIACVSGGAVVIGTAAVVSVLADGCRARRWGLLLLSYWFLSSLCVFVVDKRYT
jgi:hypothetical protein